MNDNVNNPKHYTSHKSGIEDLKKAAWYINREIQLREKSQ